MSKETAAAPVSGGIGFGGMLFLLFLGLKLGHVIDWSWWWVTAPLWIPACLVLGIFVVIFFIFLIALIFGASKS